MVRYQQSCSNTGDMSFEERQHNRMQVVYSRKMHERRVFLDELTALRRKREKATLKYIMKLIGPKWYQALSVNQRQSLDTLHGNILKDLLEGCPNRTLGVMKALGLYPRPNKIDVMNCIYFGRDDPKEMLAELYLCTYGTHFDFIESEYSLNAKLILSGIYYLGLKSLIKLLKERFKPEPEKKTTDVKKTSKIIKTPAISPYLEHQTAILYDPPRKPRFQPAPLPNLDDLNKPWEPKPNVKKKLPPPPLPPPPQPKKRLPQSYCEKLAGFMTIQPYSSPTTVKVQPHTRTGTYTSAQHSRNRKKMLFLLNEKKNYGVGGFGTSARKSRQKPVVPTTSISSAHFMISGVFRIQGKNVYVLGNITIIAPSGDLLHRGHTSIEGEEILIHGGYKAYEPNKLPIPCDCLKQWTGTILQYVRRTKCYCGHNYDFRNEGHFSNDELAFFQKPTSHGPAEFNLENIFSMDPKTNLVRKKFNKLWKTDSILNDGKVVKTRKPLMRASNTCLGKDPRPEDYLRCALRYMQDENIAAKLPDIHLAPELKEWMHRRIYGPYSRAEKKALLRKSRELWTLLDLATKRGLGRVRIPKPSFDSVTTWYNKEALNVEFRKYTKRYRVNLYNVQANVTNMLWPTMFHDKFPDKHFREVFFSYVYEKIDDVQLMHPFTLKEALFRYYEILGKRLCCTSEEIADLTD